MSDPEEPAPPAEVRLALEEAPELLAALEESRDALLQTDHLAELVMIETQIQLLSRKPGFR